MKMRFGWYPSAGFGTRGGPGGEGTGTGGGEGDGDGDGGTGGRPGRRPAVWLQPVPGTFGNQSSDLK